MGFYEIFVSGSSILGYIGLYKGYERVYIDKGTTRRAITGFR